MKYISKFSLTVCLVTIATPVFAQRYSSAGEAFFVGALQAIFISLIIWAISAFRKGKKKHNKENCPNGIKSNIESSSRNIQCETNSSKTITPWEEFKRLNPSLADEIQTLVDRDMTKSSSNDIEELATSFERWSRNAYCKIGELKAVCIGGFTSRFSDDELPNVLEQIDDKIKEEATKFGISEKNTISYFMRMWLREYLSSGSGNSNNIAKSEEELRAKVRLAINSEVKRVQAKFESTNDPFVGRAFLDVALTKFTSDLRNMLAAFDTDLTLDKIIEEEKKTALNKAFK